MAPKFGTSGLRGLVTELTPALVAAHVRAFANTCDVGTGLYLGRDRRASSPAIAGVVGDAARAMGLGVTGCGVVPTPALALAAGRAGAAAIMVTGSHIPADRNGLKFYTPTGEITKADEARIVAALDPAATAAGHAPQRAAAAECDAGAAYVARYVAGFGPRALAGWRIGVWTHSAAGGKLMVTLLAALGAEVVEIGRSERFVPVDTEALDGATRARLAGWAHEHALHAIVSTDGDGDRPLLADDAGRLIAGDVLGQIAAAALGAEVVVTPVSSNTGVEAGVGPGGRFARVIRTRIGSPHVIAAMAAAGAGAGAGARVVGYEANGGFLLGFEAAGPAGPIAPLMTRDAVLPVLAALVAAGAGGLAARVAREPARFTATGLVRAVATGRGQALVAHLAGDAAARAAFLAAIGAAPEAALERTEGLRITLADGRIVHLRPSGNAPEMRFYAEAGTAEAAGALLRAGLAELARLFAPDTAAPGAP